MSERQSPSRQTAGQGGGSTDAIIDPRDSAAKDTAERYASWVPMRWLRELRSTPTDLSVLIAIASFADDAGRSFPKIETIASATGVRRDRVSAAITALCECGYLTRQLRPRDSSLYFIHGYKQIGPHSPVSIATEMGTVQRVVTIPIDGYLPSHSAAVVSKQRSKHEVIVDDAAQKIVTGLVERGISTSVATKAVHQHRTIAQAWLAVADWKEALPGARNAVAIVTVALKNGERPPQVEQRDRLDDSLQRKLLAMERGTDVACIQDFEQHSTVKAAVDRIFGRSGGAA